MSHATPNAERKAMIKRAHDLPISNELELDHRQAEDCGEVEESRSPDDRVEARSIEPRRALHLRANDADRDQLRDPEAVALGHDVDVDTDPSHEKVEIDRVHDRQ